MSRIISLSFFVSNGYEHLNLILEPTICSHSKNIVQYFAQVTFGHDYFTGIHWLSFVSIHSFTVPCLSPIFLHCCFRCIFYIICHSKQSIRCALFKWNEDFIATIHCTLKLGIISIYFGNVLGAHNFLTLVDCTDCRCWSESFGKNFRHAI